MWSLYEQEKRLGPLTFSNGKTQEDIVKEVIKAISEGHKVIFIKGVCGTGKSVIALNLAKELGRASIVVPVKALQKQYEDDYTNKKYVLKDNGEKLRIKVIAGRNNFQCAYINENSFNFSSSPKREGDAKLSDFQNMLNKLIEKKEKESILNSGKRKDSSCGNPFLPCTIEIKEKNLHKIKEFIKKNPKVRLEEFDNVHKVKRFSIAPICPYWSPILPSEIDFRIDAKKLQYNGLNGRKYTIYQRKEGCGYYNQFSSYIDADAIIFNSQKYKIENLMNRKPETEVEIIDECDEFLDSFANIKKININRMYFALGEIFSEEEKINGIIAKLTSLLSVMLKDNDIEELISKESIVPLNETKILSIIRDFLDSNFMDFVECDEENYCYHCDEVARTFEHFIDETYASFHREDNGITVKLITTNLEKRFKELLDKNKTVVMMSGTIHSDAVLKNIFGLKDYKIIEAEASMPGKITRLRTGREIDCNYKNFQKGIVTREIYLKALEECINKSKKPTLVHVNAFSDLPTEAEASMYCLDIMTREKLDEIQYKDRTGNAIKEFKEGKIEILYSTKCSRGVDFPGETCNTIVLTKYPYPNVNSIFWRILKKTKPEYYNDFYIDKSKREFLQRIYRGLRSEKDHIFLSSPDIRVFSAFSG